MDPPSPPTVDCILGGSLRAGASWITRAEWRVYTIYSGVRAALMDCTVMRYCCPVRRAALHHTPPTPYLSFLPLNVSLSNYSSWPRTSARDATNKARSTKRSSTRAFLNVSLSLFGADFVATLPLAVGAGFSNSVFM